MSRYLEDLQNEAWKGIRRHFGNGEDPSVARNADTVTMWKRVGELLREDNSRTARGYWKLLEAEGLQVGTFGSFRVGMTSARRSVKEGAAQAKAVGTPEPASSTPAREPEPARAVPAVELPTLEKGPAGPLQAVLLEELAATNRTIETIEGSIDTLKSELARARSRGRSIYEAHAALEKLEEILS